MAENYQKQVDKIVELSNKLPKDSSIQDCDTILADILDEADHEITGIGTDVLDLYTESSDKERISQLFEVLTGTEFSDYLNKCEKIIQNQIYNNPNGIVKLVNAGLTAAEARQALIICDPKIPQIEKIYTTFEDLGNEFMSDMTVTGLHAGEHILGWDMGRTLVAMNDEKYVLLSSGRILMIKEAQSDE